MARRSEDRPPLVPQPLKRWLISLTLGTACCVAALLVWSRFERFMLRDPRFIFEGPPDFRDESANLRIDGANHASRAAIQQVFATDFGHSLYQVPIAKRRQSLLDNVKWVEDATVSRVWPDTVRVRIAERKPVAFVQISGERKSEETHGALIDAQGVVLEIENPGDFPLPVLAGIRSSHTIADRGLRVRRMLRLLEDVGPSYAEKISEIDAFDPETLKIVLQMGDRGVTLIIGNRRFKLRLDNFQSHYPDIRRRLPDARTFDLKLDDRITVVPGDDDGQ